MSAGQFMSAGQYGALDLGQYGTLTKIQGI